jgi:phosphoribosylcarboxyaminoimidazole (NCAIR) mutase
MPAGIPVATVSIGKSGAKIAAILAAQILAVSDSNLADMLTAYKQKMADKVEQKAQAIEAGAVAND